MKKINIKKYSGKQLSKLRKEKGISQTKLAIKMRTQANTVSRWESGIYAIDIQTLFNLSIFFGVDIDYFFPRLYK